MTLSFPRLGNLPAIISLLFFGIFFPLLLLGLLYCKCYAAWCCPRGSLSSLYFLKFFFLSAALFAWAPLSCVRGHWSVLLHLVCFWTPLVYFQFSNCILQLYDFCLVITFLLLFWRTSIVLPGFRGIFMTMTLNFLTGRWLLSIPLRSFSEVWSCSFIWNIFLHLVFLNSLCLFLCISWSLEVLKEWLCIGDELYHSTLP